MPRTLNHYQRLFVHYYLGDAKNDEVKAARLAGYGKPELHGPRLLRNPTICSHLEQKLEESGAMPVVEILARLSTIASLDPLEFIEFKEDVDRDGNIRLDARGNPIEKPVLDLKKMKKLQKGNLIKKLKIQPSGAIEVEFHDATDAMTNLAKYHGMNKPEQVEITHVGDAGSERIIAILGGLTQLAGAINSGTLRGEPEPGGLCDSGEQREVEPGPAPETDQPALALGRPEGD